LLFAHVFAFLVDQKSGFWVFCFLVLDDGIGALSLLTVGLAGDCVFLRLGLRWVAGLLVGCVQISLSRNERFTMLIK
jgi:hypothetical protein